MTGKRLLFLTCQGVDDHVRAFRLLTIASVTCTRALGSSEGEKSACLTVLFDHVCMAFSIVFVDIAGVGSMALGTLDGVPHLQQCWRQGDNVMRRVPGSPCAHDDGWLLL